MCHNITQNFKSQHHNRTISLHHRRCGPSYFLAVDSSLAGLVLMIQRSKLNSWYGHKFHLVIPHCVLKIIMVMAMAHPGWWNPCTICTPSMWATSIAFLSYDNSFRAFWIVEGIRLLKFISQAIKSDPFCAIFGNGSTILTAIFMSYLRTELYRQTQT